MLFISGLLESPHQHYKTVIFEEEGVDVYKLTQISYLWPVFLVVYVSKIDNKGNTKRKCRFTTYTKSNLLQKYV